MAEDRQRDDDIYVGIVFATLHPQNGRVAWRFKEYDPQDRESFPVPLQFSQAGKIFGSRYPGKIHDIENNDALAVFIDPAYQRLMFRRFVELDYDIGKVADPVKPEERVQMIGANRVDGIPTNIEPEKWCEAFFEGRPAVLFKRKLGASLPA